MRREKTNSNTGFASFGAIVAVLVALGLIGGGATYVYNEINDKHKDGYHEYENKNKGVFGRFMERGEAERYVDRMPWRQNHEEEGKKGHNPAGEIANLPKGDLSEQEKQDLFFMREEEKLARDVYALLYDKWDLKVFDHIKNSEQKHMDAVKVLLDRYNLDDPVTNDSIGHFNNQDLKTLYDKLISQGSLSQIEALKVGATIEDVDIRDLQNAITNTDNEDIKTVYENLMRGSRNHMRAFTKELSVIGASYTPQYISQEEYDAIINSDIERGHGAKGKGHGREGFGRGMNGGREGYGRYEKDHDEYKDERGHMNYERGESYENMMRGKGRVYMDDDYQEYSYKKLYGEKYVSPTQLPTKIQSYINANYPDAQVIKAEAKGRGYFEVKLSNGVELKFNKGELIYKEK